MSTTSIIACILFALACIIVAGSANAQYDYPGPPTWDRNPDDYRLPPRMRHPMYRPPPPLPPCIRNGSCAAPPVRGYGYPGFPPNWDAPHYEDDGE